MSIQASCGLPVIEYVALCFFHLSRPCSIFWTATFQILAKSLVGRIWLLQSSVWLRLKWARSKANSFFNEISHLMSYMYVLLYQLIIFSFFVYLFYRLCGLWFHCHNICTCSSILLWTTIWQNKYSGVHCNLFPDWFIVCNGMQRSWNSD